MVSRDEEQDIWDPRESIKVDISASVCLSVLCDSGLAIVIALLWFGDRIGNIVILGMRRTSCC